MKPTPNQVGLAAEAVSTANKLLDLPEPTKKLLTEEGDLGGIFDQIEENANGMLSRMASLEPVDPGLTKLEALIEEHFPGVQERGLNSIVQKAHEQRAEAHKAISEIDSVATVAEFVAVMATAAALAPEGITTPAAIALAFKGGKDLYDLFGRIKDANEQIEMLAALAAKIDETRVEFDRLWSQIQDEDSRQELKSEQQDEQ